MPSNPVPAVRAGEIVMRSEHHGKHLLAVLFRVASTGALVQISEPVRISYALAQDAMARVDGTPGPDELGFVGDVDELGAFGARIKKVAKKLAASKLIKGVKALGKVATAIVPGAGMLKAGFKATKAVASIAKGIKRGGLRSGLRAGLNAGAGFALSGNDMFPELGAAKPRALPAPKPAAKKPAPAKPAAKKPAPAKPAAKKPAPARPAAKKPAPAKPAAKKPPAKPAAKKPAAKKPAPKTPAAKKPPAKKKPAGKAPAAAATRPAAAAPVAPLAPATAAKLEQLTSQIADAAPELAEQIQQLPNTPPEERDFQDARVKEALKVIAAKPPEERPAAAAAIQQRLDAWKVISPDGTITWVPRAVAEG